MQVKVANNTYRMNREKFKGLLKIASEQVPFGIYAIEKGEYAELMHVNVKSITEFKKVSRSLKSQGFRVYGNRGQRIGAV